METASRPPLRRLMALDRMIRSGAFPNARTAAEDLEVHSRTIHRDLDFLRDSWGAPLEFCPQRNGYFYRDADYALPLLRLSEGELVALFLAERAMQHYRDTP
jgi:predicted DNA-binding transcriptional regulator YafY